MFFNSKSNDFFRLNCKIPDMYVTLMNYRMKTKFVLAIYDWCLIIRFGNGPTQTIFKRRYCRT